MRESQFVLEWKNEARVETRRADLLRVLELRMQAPVPEDLAQTISEMTDLSALQSWLEAALRAESYDAFRAIVQPLPEPAVVVSTGSPG